MKIEFRMLDSLGDDQVSRTSIFLVAALEMRPAPTYYFELDIEAAKYIAWYKVWIIIK